MRPLGGVALRRKDSRCPKANPIKKDCFILVTSRRSPTTTSIHEWEGVAIPSRHISGSSCNNSCVGETFCKRGFDKQGRARPLSQPQGQGPRREAQPWDELNHDERRSEGLVTKRCILTWGVSMGLFLHWFLEPLFFVQVSEIICKCLDLLWEAQLSSWYWSEVWNHSCILVHSFSSLVFSPVH